MYDDTQLWLNKAQATASVFSAVVLYQGQPIAKLYERDPDNLEQRAARFVECCGFTGATFEVHAA